MAKLDSRVTSAVIAAAIIGGVVGHGVTVGIMDKKVAKARGEGREEARPIAIELSKFVGQKWGMKVYSEVGHKATFVRGAAERNFWGEDNPNGLYIPISRAREAEEEKLKEEYQEMVKELANEYATNWAGFKQ